MLRQSDRSMFCFVNEHEVEQGPGRLFGANSSRYVAGLFTPYADYTMTRIDRKELMEAIRREVNSMSVLQTSPYVVKL